MTEFQLRPEEVAATETFDAALAAGLDDRAALRRMVLRHPQVDVARGGRREFMSWLGERQGGRLSDEGVLAERVSLLARIEEMGPGRELSVADAIVRDALRHQLRRIEEMAHDRRLIR